MKVLLAAVALALSSAVAGEDMTFSSDKEFTFLFQNPEEEPYEDAVPSSKSPGSTDWYAEVAPRTPLLYRVKVNGMIVTNGVMSYGIQDMLVSAPYCTYPDRPDGAWGVNGEWFVGNDADYFFDRTDYNLPVIANLDGFIPGSMRLSSEQPQGYTFFPVVVPGSLPDMEFAVDYEIRDTNGTRTVTNARATAAPDYASSSPFDSTQYEIFDVPADRLPIYGPPVTRLSTESLAAVAHVADGFCERVAYGSSGNCWDYTSRCYPDEWQYFQYPVDDSFSAQMYIDSPGTGDRWPFNNVPVSLNAWYDSDGGTRQFSLHPMRTSPEVLELWGKSVFAAAALLSPGRYSVLSSPDLYPYPVNDEDVPTAGFMYRPGWATDPRLPSSVFDQLVTDAGFSGLLRDCLWWSTTGDIPAVEQDTGGSNPTEFIPDQGELHDAFPEVGFKMYWDGVGEGLGHERLDESLAADLKASGHGFTFSALKPGWGFATDSSDGGDPLTKEGPFVSLLSRFGLLGTGSDAPVDYDLPLLTEIGKLHGCRMEDIDVPGFLASNAFSEVSVARIDPYESDRARCGEFRRISEDVLSDDWYDWSTHPGLMRIDPVPLALSSQVMSLCDTVYQVPAQSSDNGLQEYEVATYGDYDIGYHGISADDPVEVFSIVYVPSGSGLVDITAEVRGSGADYTASLSLSDGPYYGVNPVGEEFSSPVGVMRSGPVTDPDEPNLSSCDDLDIESKCSLFKAIYPGMRIATRPDVPYPTATGAFMVDPHPNVVDERSADGPYVTLSNSRAAIETFVFTFPRPDDPTLVKVGVKATVPEGPTDVYYGERTYRFTTPTYYYYRTGDDDELQWGVGRQYSPIQSYSNGRSGDGPESSYRVTDYVAGTVGRSVFGSYSFGSDDAVNLSFLCGTSADYSTSEDCQSWLSDQEQLWASTAYGILKDPSKGGLPYGPIDEPDMYAPTPGYANFEGRVMVPDSGDIQDTVVDCIRNRGRATDLDPVMYESEEIVGTAEYYEADYVSHRRVTSAGEATQKITRFLDDNYEVTEYGYQTWEMSEPVITRRERTRIGPVETGTTEGPVVPSGDPEVTVVGETNHVSYVIVEGRGKPWFLREEDIEGYVRVTMTGVERHRDVDSVTRTITYYDKGGGSEIRTTKFKVYGDYQGEQPWPGGGGTRTIVEQDIHQQVRTGDGDLFNVVKVAETPIARTFLYYYWVDVESDGRGGLKIGSVISLQPAEPDAPALDFDGDYIWITDEYWDDSEFRRLFDPTESGGKGYHRHLTLTDWDDHPGGVTNECLIRWTNAFGTQSTWEWKNLKQTR